MVTGPSGSTASIVSVGEDFEYDIGASRANKHFSLSGVRIASLATSYVAESASVPPSLRIALRVVQPLAAPAAASLLALGLVGLASVALRRRTPVWLAAPGVGVLSFALVALPYTAQAATLTVGAGRYGRHAEPILAYLVDHLGTVRAAVNRDGIVVETRDYAPFGESISHVGAFSVQHRFTGQPQDDQEGGLYDYGARFYNPKWGRFVSPDEAVQGFDSQGLNPFAYVLNRPTSATDPDGRLIWNGVSYGARATDIFGNVTGEGRGPTSGDKGQITVSGSSVHANSNGAPPGFFRFNFLDPGRDEVTIDPLTGAEPTGDVGALAGAVAAAALGVLIEAYSGEGAEEPLCKDPARRDDSPIYHRKESPTQTPEDARRQEESGELWGRESRYGAWPQAKAFKGPLPPGQRGIEFTTSVKPDGSHPRIATWSGPRSGVRVEGGYAKVNIFVFRNTQR